MMQEASFVMVICLGCIYVARRCLTWGKCTKILPCNFSGLAGVFQWVSLNASNNYLRTHQVPSILLLRLQSHIKPGELFPR
jgi:hypothetical protein